MRWLVYAFLTVGAVSLIVSAYFLVSSNGGGLGVASIPLFSSPREARILFVGDMMFDRTIRSVGERHGYGRVLSSVSEYLKGFDMVVGNLEGPVTHYSSVSVGTLPGEDGNTRFTFDAAVPALLFSHNIRLVGLGNNHILDFGSEGLVETKNALDEAGVFWVGNPHDQAENVRFLTRNKITFAFISFNQFLGRDVAETTRLIKEVRENVDVVIVLAHWGEEYTEKPSSYVIPWAHAFVDAGADLIIGSHPHVVLSKEEYEGKIIYYSLGNFVFDQYWNTQVSCGEGVSLAIRKEGRDISLKTEETSFGLRLSGETVLGCSQ